MSAVEATLEGQGKKRRVRMAGVATLAALAVAVSACGSSSNKTTSGNTSSNNGGTSATTSSGGASPGGGSAGNKNASFTGCMVTDTGGINDRSFNASAWEGMKAAAAKDSKIQVKYLQSSSSSDYVPNINTFLGQKCGIIVTVGYLMAQATQNAAKANPNAKFSIVDNQYVPAVKNILALTYETNQDAFLGGYLAAAMSKSKVVGTFGGQNIPTVTIYMNGWVAGVRYYNKINHADVKVLGWTPTSETAGKGEFTNSFTNTAAGQSITQTLISNGADIIFPVAGDVGQGAAQAVKQAGSGHYMEWVDTDGCVSAPQYCSLFITSVTKGIVTSVSDAVLSAAKGTFKGGNYYGTLANGGVALSPYHQFAGKIPSSVTSELAKIKAGIINGSISVDPMKYPAS